MCTSVHHRSIDINDGGGHLGARCRLHGGAGEGTAKRPDLPPSRPEPARSDHRGNGRARTHAREMKRVKRWRDCQRRTSIGLNRSAEGPHAHLRTRQSADINIDDEDHGSLAPCELTRVLHGVAGCSAAHTRRACAPHACSKPVGSISRLPTGAFAASNLKVLLGSTGTSNIFFQLSWPEFRAWQRD